VVFIERPLPWPNPWLPGKRQVKEKLHVCVWDLWQRYAMDAAFYMAKELLMTERTYKKDLQVIAVVSKEHIKFIF